MTQPDPRFGPPQGYGPQYPNWPYPQPYAQASKVEQVPAGYHKLRTVSLVSVVLIGLTCLTAIVQTVLLWRSFDDVKRFAYGLVSERELEQAVNRFADTSPLIDVVSYLMMGTGIAFLVWLWQARENALFLRARREQPYEHRQSQPWVVGSWICPVVQFWYPLQIVADVSAASEPMHEPGAAKNGQFRALLYGWWTAWTAFWVLLVGGALTAVFAFTIWLVRLVEQVETADASGSDLDIYDLQDFLVQAALVVDVCFTVATVLLIVAGATVSLLILRVTTWQDTEGLTPQSPPGEPPRYAPRTIDVPQYAPRSFPPR